MPSTTAGLQKKNAQMVDDAGIQTNLVGLHGFATVACGLTDCSSGKTY